MLVPMIFGYLINLSWNKVIQYVFFHNMPIQDETVNKRKLSRSIDYETSTLAKRKISSPNKQPQQPVRRKTYAGNITFGTNNHFGENNNLEQFEGIDLVKGNCHKPEIGRKIPVYNSANAEFIPETEEDDANDYIDVYLRKISKTRYDTQILYSQSGQKMPNDFKIP